MKKRFSIQKTILSDFALFAIVDNEQNKVVCHFVYDNGEEYCDEMANFILEALNEPNCHHEDAYYTDMRVKFCRNCRRIIKII